MFEKSYGLFCDAHIAKYLQHAGKLHKHAYYYRLVPIQRLFTCFWATEDGKIEALVMSSEGLPFR